MLIIRPQKNYWQKGNLVWAATVGLVQFYCAVWWYLFRLKPLHQLLRFCVTAPQQYNVNGWLGRRSACAQSLLRRWKNLCADCLQRRFRRHRHSRLILYSYFPSQKTLCCNALSWLASRKRTRTDGNNVMVIEEEAAKSGRRYTVAIVGRHKRLLRQQRTRKTRRLTRISPKS